MGRIVETRLFSDVVCVLINYLGGILILGNFGAQLIAHNKNYSRFRSNLIQISLILKFH